MTDAQLEVFLGIADETAENRAKLLRSITPEKRALYEHMAQLVTQLNVWSCGLGPKPKGVIICGCGRRGRHEHGRRWWVKQK
jgi:hypothetical protein